ncbi:MAG: 2-phospho-L-lactate guanylyltransferase [Burkholderiales bacterium]|jgi:2-phospho-L-lactate guanylyltransferase|nr:2-phospho-L-lactate guanylyltransferase [Burkholderiales bacterium]
MPRQLHAVIPVKPFEEGKTRLAGMLSPSERVALNRQLLLRTLERASTYPGAARTVVVSRSREVLRIAREHGCQALSEPPPHGLNAAVQWGALHARECGADAVLVMPVDLPCGSGDDLRRLVETAPRGPVCVLVPDHHGQGTNLLFQSPVALDDYAFGPGSLVRHRLMAWREGLQPVVQRDSVFAFDIDEPADYLRWRPTGDVAAATAASRPEPTLHA